MWHVDPMEQINIVSAFPAGSDANSDLTGDWVSPRRAAARPNEPSSAMAAIAARWRSSTSVMGPSIARSIVRGD